VATYQTLGIILSKTDRGQADQLFSIYTSNHGKISALGRGTKKIESKLNCQLQFFCVINLMIAVGRNYDHIAGALIVQDFCPLKKNIKKIVMASFGLELVDKLTKLSQSEEKIFDLLFKYLVFINSSAISPKAWSVLRRRFVNQLLILSGLGPKADIASDPEKLDIFLKNQLDFELKTERFLTKIYPNRDTNLTATRHLTRK
jgi:DNA repair protein RecO (recombination protein O)